MDTPQGNPSTAGGGNDVEQNKVLAAVSYLYFIGVILLFVKKDSPFVQFHAKQATGLAITWTIWWLLYMVPVLNVFWFLIGWIVAIPLIIFAIISFIKALQGERYEIPVIGDLAKKINV